MTANSFESRVHVYSFRDKVPNPPPLNVLPTPEGVLQVCGAKSLSKIVAACKKNKFCVWEKENENEEYKRTVVPLTKEKEVTGCAITDDGRLIAITFKTGSKSGGIQLYTNNFQSPKKTISLNEGRPDLSKFSVWGKRKYTLAVQVSGSEEWPGIIYCNIDFRTFWAEIETHKICSTKELSLYPKTKKSCCNCCTCCKKKVSSSSKAKKNCCTCCTDEASLIRKTQKTCCDNEVSSLHGPPAFDLSHNGKYLAVLPSRNQRLLIYGRNSYDDQFKQEDIEDLMFDGIAYCAVDSSSQSKSFKYIAGSIPDNTISNFDSNEAHCMPDLPKDVQLVSLRAKQEHLITVVALTSVGVQVWMYEDAAQSQADGSVLNRQDTAVQQRNNSAPRNFRINFPPNMQNGRINYICWNSN